jgi:D-arabinose 1-dehydrogenase-like Zn-dependent alcohol dehydrogenase
MKRARLIATGWDRDLEIDEVETPPVTGNQVLVEVAACGVCYRDIVDRDGRFAFIRIPVSPGHEVTGRVAAVGPSVTEWKVGDRVSTMHRDSCGACPACAAGDTSLCDRAAAVLGLIVDGGYATHLVVPERALYAAPADISAPAAAVLHCTFGTAYRGLTRFGRPGPGDRVVITGANGGVGCAAVQIARRLGAEVVAVVRDEAAVEFVAGLGANDVVVDPGDGFHKRIGARRADVALDCVGQPTFNASLRSVRVGGRLVVVGNVVPERANLNLGYVITRGIVIVGSSGANRDDMAAVLALHAAEPLSFQVTEMSLDRADEAQRAVRAGGLRGRIALVP